MFRVEYSTFGGPGALRVADAPVPVPDDHDVVVRVRAASINPSDANKRSGAIRPMYLREPRPYGMGMDVAGEVVAAGTAVTGLGVGDRVLGMTKNGDGFAEQTLVRERDAVAFGHELSFAEAACIAMSGSTAQILRTRITAPACAPVLVNGAAGGVGLFLAQLLHLDGLTVTGTATGAGLDVLRAAGIPSVVDYHHLDTALRNRRFTAIVDTSGKLCAKRARAMLADPGSYRTLVPSPSVLLGALATARSRRTVRPIFAFATADASRTVVQLVQTGEVHVTVGAELPLTDAIDTIAAVEVDRLKVPGKVVLHN